jgi:ProP effector
MRFYVSRVMYLQSLVEGAGRVDLDGNVCGEVTASDAEHARSRVAGIMAARDAQAAAAKAARKAGKAAGKAVCPKAPTTPPPPKPPPAASAAPANSVVKLKDQPVLTLPAFRKVKEAVS